MFFTFINVLFVLILTSSTNAFALTQLNTYCGTDKLTDAKESVTGLAVYIQFPDDPVKISEQHLDCLLNQPDYEGEVTLFDDSITKTNGSVRDFWYDSTSKKLDLRQKVVFYKAPLTRAQVIENSKKNGRSQKAEINDVIYRLLDLLGNNNYPFGDLTLLSQSNRLEKECQTHKCVRSFIVIFSGFGKDIGGGGGYRTYLTGPAIDQGSVRLSRLVITSDVSASPRKKNKENDLYLNGLVHELGHEIYPWPDLYNDGSINFGLMGGSASRNNPLPPEPHLLIKEGLSREVSLNNVRHGDIVTLKTNDASEYYVYRRASEPKQYFVFQAVRPIGRYAASQGGGLVIWRIDETMPTNGKKTEWRSKDQYRSTTVVQADNRFDLERKQNGGDILDYYGVSKSFSGQVAHWPDGTPTGLFISNILQDPLRHELSFKVHRNPTTDQIRVVHSEYLMSKDWRFVGLGDVVEDEKSELVWRSTKTNKVVAWSLSRQLSIKNHSLGDANPSLRIVAIGDIDGDGKDDLIWRGKSVRTYYGHPTTLREIGGDRGGALPDPKIWHLLGSTDVNGSGTDDLLWQNVERLNVWWMEHGKSVRRSNIGYGEANALQTNGVADIDGDGKTEYVWQSELGKVYTLSTNL